MADTAQAEAMARAQLKLQTEEDARKKVQAEETAKVEARIAEYSESWWGGPASLLRDSQADGYAGLTGSLTETITALPTALSSWFWGGGTAAPAATSSSSSARPALASLTTPGRP